MITLALSLDFTTLRVVFQDMVSTPCNNSITHNLDSTHKITFHESFSRLQPIRSHVWHPFTLCNLIA